ncbi:AAA family ATPase [Bacillus infantis]|uniref:AAA family ATPase n=1 Tax=Bacillus infantis TaxID=324767 RepID=UPI00344EB92B
MPKQLKLVSLSLRNFKGVKSFHLDACAENVKVYGDNATGKTTLFDSFVWLLFDKDSQNKKDFAIKSLDLSGKELHGLEHEVEGIFLLDGRQITLRKVYSEKWTKKRGSATAEFTGHTTDYYVDGVPSKLKDYKEQVDSIVKEDIFKLLTSPSFFNEQLKKEERRKILMEVCGDISDEEVIASEQSLLALPNILQGRTIENHRKVIAARRSEINKELDKIPVRIDEIKRSMPEVDQLNKKDLEEKVNALNESIDEKMVQISQIRNGKSISDKQMAIQQIEMDLIHIKRNHNATSNEQIYQLKARIQEEESNSSILKAKLENVKNKKRYNDDTIKETDNILAQLRQQWHDLNNEEFIHTDACECPACGQALPEDQVTAAREKALSQFNLKKAQKLADINAKGKQGKERKEELHKNNEALALEYDRFNGQIEEKQLQIEKVKVQLNQLEGMVTDVLDNPSYVAKITEKKAIEEQIKGLQEMAEQSVQDIQSEISFLKEERNQLQGAIGKFILAEQSEKRIEELTDQERLLAAEYEKLEHELFLTEEFIRTKVNLLEDRINSRFKYARFNLFKTNLNGGLEEICETTYKGVPYSSGLNNAARINVGLDIINTLAEHYGFFAPIFIDNSEAVTKLIDTSAQTVSLVVSEQDKELRIEKEELIESEAV